MVNDVPQIHQHSVNSNKKIKLPCETTHSVGKRNPLKNEILSHPQSNLAMTKSLIFQSLANNKSTYFDKTDHPIILHGTKMS